MQMSMRPKLSPEQIMALIEDMLRNAPEFPYEGSLSTADLKWLGRAESVIEAAGYTNDLLDFRVARKSLGTMTHSRTEILGPLHNVHSKSELLAPASAQGAFIPAGDTWNGYAAIVKLVQQPCDDLLIVDPYVNSDLFTDFAPHVVAKRGLRCITAKRSENHAGLEASQRRWSSDHPEKPVEVRYSPPKELHDRLIIIDDREVWLVSQSLKDIAKRSPASVSKADPEIAEMKSAHYTELWSKSETIS